MDRSYINQRTELANQNTSDLTKLNSKVKSDIPKYWDKDFINARLNDIQNTSHYEIFFVLWRTGIRVSELVGIRKRDIDFENFMLKIKWLKNRRYEERNIPLHPEVKNLLVSYTRTMKQEDLIFGITRQRVWQLSKKYFGDNPHRFRHSFAVNWLRNNGDVFILCRYLGHSSIQTTMKYLSIVPIDQGKELLKIDFN
jgi:integrase